jgi:hypothetical protein
MRHPSLRGDNSKRVKIYKRYLKIFFSRTTGQYQPDLAQIILRGRGFKFEQMRGSALL